MWWLSQRSSPGPHERSSSHAWTTDQRRHTSVWLYSAYPEARPRACLQSFQRPHFLLLHSEAQQSLPKEQAIEVRLAIHQIFRAPSLESTFHHILAYSFRIGIEEVSGLDEESSSIPQRIPTTEVLSTAEYTHTHTCVNGARVYSGGRNALVSTQSRSLVMFATSRGILAPGGGGGGKQS